MTVTATLPLATARKRRNAKKPFEWQISRPGGHFARNTRPAHEAKHPSRPREGPLIAQIQHGNCPQAGAGVWTVKQSTKVAGWNLPVVFTLTHFPLRPDGSREKIAVSGQVVSIRETPKPVLPADIQERITNWEAARLEKMTLRAGFVRFSCTQNQETHFDRQDVQHTAHHSVALLPLRFW
jgi:hypothetical protein